MTQGSAYSESPVLAVGIDVSKSEWSIALATSGSPKTPYTKIPRGSEELLRRAIESGRRKLGLPTECPVVVCHEAGRDGFWIHRWLSTLGYESIVVHAASIHVDQRVRRAKTDRIDARKLARDLVRYVSGERSVFRAVNVPTVEQEDARRPQRELETLKKERTQHVTRIKSLLVICGVYVEDVGPLLAHLDAVRVWDGSPLPSNLRTEIEREAARLALIESEIAQLKKQQEERLAKSTTDTAALVRKLAMLKGVGTDSAWLLVTELFGWRVFKNREEVAGAAGLGGTPFSSGTRSREQGISKEGNRRVRTRMVELAWKWIQFQPQSDLAEWFRRFAASGRLRRVGIVAVARKLLVAMWHFLEHDIVPTNATLKSRLA